MKLFLVFLVALTACETQECKELKVEVEERKNLVRSARNQAAAFEPSKKRAMAAEGNANKLLRALGVDQPESKMNAELSARVAKIPTATISRGAVQLPLTGAQGEVPESVTQWTVTFDAKDSKAAFDHTALLIQNPPIIRFSALIREDKTKNRWRVELRRATVDQIPINPILQPLKTARSLSEIPGSFGFCGASDMRAEIEKIDAEVAQLRQNAEGLTVEMPKAASYEGLRRRAEAMRDEEAETRDHLAVFEEALAKSGAKLKAVGTEGSMSVLEVWGTLKDRAKVEQALGARGLAGSIQPRKEAAAGVERILIRNATVERRLRPVDAQPKFTPPGEERGHEGHD